MAARVVGLAVQGPRGAWYSDSLSLATWAGQTVSLRFVVTTDSSSPSSFFVDDVSLG